MKPVCRFPGCDRTLGDRCTTGVCRRHNHAQGYCGCANCVRLWGIPDGPEPVRDLTRRTVHVPVVTLNNFAPATAAITLPREPWEPEDAA